jgi:hypothetical protein
MNLLNTSPLEVQYQVFDLLDYIALARTRVVDELYYSRRHKSKFAAVRGEIEAIEYSVDGSTSTMVIGKSRTICEWRYRARPNGTAIDLIIRSRDLSRRIGSVTEIHHTRYKRDLDGGLKLLRTITTKNRTGQSYVRFYEEIAFKHAGKYHAIN